MKKFLLITDAGNGQDEWYHAGDEATFLSLYSRIQTRFPTHEIHLWARSIPKSIDIPSTRVIYSDLLFKKKSRYIYFLLFKFCLKFKLYSFLSKIFPDFNKINRSVSLIDDIIVCGGGNLNSLFPEYIFNRAIFVALVKHLHKKIYFAPQTVGPISNISDFLLMRYILKKSDFLQVRESLSPRLTRGVSENIELTFDDALRLDKVSTIESGEPSEGIKVALSMRDFDSERNAESIAKAITQIKQHYTNCTFYLLPHIFDIHNNGDLVIMKEVMEKTNTSYVSIDSNYFTAFPTKRPEEILLNLTATMDLVLTSRYHGAIFGLYHLVPTVCFFDTDYYKTKFLGIEALLTKKYKVKGFHFVDTRHFDSNFFNTILEKENSLKDKKDEIFKDIHEKDILRFVKEV